MVKRRRKMNDAVVDINQLKEELLGREMVITSKWTNEIKKDLIKDVKFVYVQWKEPPGKMLAISLCGEKFSVVFYPWCIEVIYFNSYFPDQLNEGVLVKVNGKHVGEIVIKHAIAWRPIVITKEFLDSLG
ncbi:MAG: hypothetical protein C0412_20000 [Flavobacterium sp.]|nr:hypothetical protein [Flavobacterium sp.]